MPAHTQNQADAAQLLEDIRHVNRLARSTAERLDAQLRQRVEETWMPGPAADALIEEIGTALGALTARVQLAEDGVRALQRDIERRRGSLRARALTSGSVVFPCDRLASGDNLYDLETSAEGVSFRWSGANPRIDLVLPVTRERPCDLEIVLFAMIRPNHGRELHLSVDGKRVPHRFSREGVVFLLRTALPSSKAPETRLSIELPSTHSPAELGRNADQRQLGIAISEIRFIPRPGLLSRILRRLRLAR